MMDTGELREKLLNLKDVRKNGDLLNPDIGWRVKALEFFDMLCGNDKTKGIERYITLNSLSEDFAIECMAELDQYFYTFGFMNEIEKKQWEELSGRLRMIYT